MKNLFLILLLIVSQSVICAFGQTPVRTAQEYIRPYSEPFQYGINLGYYNVGWSDEQLAGLAQSAGVHSVRPTLPEKFVEQYGYSIRANTFDAYLNTYGMKELTCFVEGPSVAHSDPTIYPGGTRPSRLFANLYEPVWNADGSVNSNNYYAHYLYRLLQIYGDKVRFWEVVNEPDFTYGGNMNDWLTRSPLPDEVPNLQAPIFHYVRMLRISYEVIKKYRPDAYVTVGGVGYPQFVDALLRYTDNPAGGTVTPEYPRTAGAYLDALSFHSYPAYALHTWDNSISGFRYSRSSDYAATQMLKDRQAMANVLTRYGYGSTYPAKQLLMSETNIGRRTSDDRTGSDEMQRNYGIKALVLAQKNDIRQFYLYQLGESVNAPTAGTSVSGSDELALMGLFENLKRDAPGTQRITQQGQAFATTSRLLHNWSYDAARTAALALPAGADGAAFSKNGAYTYVLWAKALTDNTETASATYSFPAAWGLGSVNRYEWNHATTNTKTTQSAQGIALSGSPLFFTAATPTLTPGGCAGAGSLTRDQWDNVPGATVASVPTATPPSSSAPITQFEAPAQAASNYAARLRGYLCPPQSGPYTFWLVADDAAELYLSSDADPARKVRLATCTGWTASARDFARYPSQRSAPVQLLAGQRYYVEALHKQEWGPGYLAVAWTIPNGLRQEPIPGTALLPFNTPAGSTPQQPPSGGITGSTTGTVSGTRARITVAFAAPAASATASIAPTLYNKPRVLQFEEDDAPATAFTDLYPLLQGGTRNGLAYPGLRFSDGCGRLRPYTAAVAINGHNPYNNSVWLDVGPNHDPAKLIWAQAQQLVRSGWDVENHSDLHSATNPAQQITDLDYLIANRLQGYQPTVHIVPVNFAGYPTAAFAAGYAAVSSNSQSDNLAMLNPNNASRLALSTLPVPGVSFVYNRYLADKNGSETTAAHLARLNALSDALLAPGPTTPEIYLQRVFSHGLDFSVLTDWLNYTHSIAQDRLWVTTLREFTEYRRVRSQVAKTETFNGDTLTIDLDYTNLSSNTRFQNLTLLVNSPGTIASITVTGADSATFNTDTKMVNIFRRQLATPTFPTSPTPTPGGCAGAGSLTRDQWDNVPGATVASVPTATPPSSSAPITQFEAPAQAASNYAARLRGYLCPPQSGPYTFWLVADDAAELYLSSDADPARKVRLATCTGWTASARDFARYPSQRSAPVQLLAGQRYYVEALHKQEWGPGYLAVAWTIPNGLRQEPIPGTALLPFNTPAGRMVSTALGMAPLAGTLRTELTVAPNPASQAADETQVLFRVAQDGPVALSLLNLNGQVVRKLYVGDAAAGIPRNLPLPVAGLSEGLYIVRLVTDREVLNQKVIIGR